MKFTRWQTVIDETVIELKTDLPTTVDRLRAQQGYCRSSDNNDRLLEFTCDKKGRIRVDNVRSGNGGATASRLNFVADEVVEQDGKTLVKIYVVHDRSTKKWRNVEWTVYALVFVVFLLIVAVALAQGASLMWKDIATAGGFLLLLFLIPFNTAKETENQQADLEMMKTEAINRARAVDRWDD